jgi:predicted nucleotidyltransferase
LHVLFEAERGMAQALAHDLRPLLEGQVLSAGLLGSFARGEARPGSDIDLLGIVETLKARERLGVAHHRAKDCWQMAAHLMESARALATLGDEEYGNRRRHLLHPLKIQLAVQVRRFIEDKWWTQTEAAQAVGLGQTEVSDLHRVRLWLSDAHGAADIYGHELPPIPF